MLLTVSKLIRPQILGSIENDANDGAKKACKRRRRVLNILTSVSAANLTLGGPPQPTPDPATTQSATLTQAGPPAPCTIVDINFVFSTLPYFCANYFLHLNPINVEITHAHTHKHTRTHTHTHTCSIDTHTSARKAKLDFITKSQT